MSTWLGPLLLESTVHAAAVLAAAWAAARLARNAAVRHAIWSGAVLASLIMPLLLLLAPAVPLRLPNQALQGVGVLWEQIGGGSEPAVAVNPPSAARTAMQAGREPPPGLAGGWAAPADEPVRAALLAWAGVSLLLLVRMATGMVLVARLRRRARPLRSPAWIRACDEYRARYGIRRPVRLLASDAVAAPAAVGWLRPAVLLPPAAEEWKPEDVRAVLAHELAHVARGDCLTQDAARLACALYPINPLMWMAERTLRRECETACDDQVILAGVSPVAYARLLVETVRAARPRPPAGALAMGRPGELERRVLAILDPAVRRIPLSARARRMALVLSAAALAASATLRVESAPAQEAPPPRAGEPDLRGDSIASPLSERIPAAAGVPSARLGESGERGPDSLLVRLFRAELARVPQWEGDLVRERAAWALGRIRDGRLVEPLLEALSDGDWRVRAYAAWALAKSGDARAVPGLLAALQDPVWRLRAMAAYALQEIGDPAARAAMTRALSDEAWQVRHGAVHYLARFADPAARTLVRGMLADRHVAVRSAAAEALAG